jgi:iron complex transport system substrate-binding protein
MNTRTLVAALAGLSLVAAACGSDSDSDESTSTEPATTEPVDTEPATTDDVPTTPERVVSLSPTHTEIMFAIGAGDLLVAVDDFSNYPAEALELPNELSGFEPNVEAIASYEPDLVLIGGDFTGLGDQLAELDIESWDGPAASAISDTYTQIEQLGAATGNVAEAAELVSSMQTRIDEIVAESGDSGAGLSFYHELDPTYFSADSSTFIGEVYTALGLANIADGDDTESFGFPQLNAEFIVAANPELIFLADTKCCNENADTVAARPGWDAIAAVQNGDVIEMDDDIASRWGPRIVDYLEDVALAVANVEVGVVAES